jgi:hypothetical protein
MKTKHTPGPWLFRGKSNSVHAAPTEINGYQYGKELFRFDPENVPSVFDIDLILAAPDLLDALKAILPFIPKSTVLDGGPNKYSAAVIAADKVRAAIAKAEGNT